MLTLFGYGITNKAIAKRFRGKCVVFDDKFVEPSVDEYGNNLMPSSMFDPNNSTIEIVTPGIPPNHELVKKAKNLVSEYDFFSDSMPYSIWISGTNGKTSTTEMTGRLLEKRGAIIGGNIGTPLATLDSKAPIWVLETSSFQLHYTKKATPNIYLLLPITDDHASWHGSFKEYERSKLTPLERMQEGELAIVPKKYEDIKTDAFCVFYEDTATLASYFGIEIEKIKHKEPFLFNATMALAVSKVLFDELDYELINSYKIGAHKIEEFFDTKNRLWVDDSKATNIDATIKALMRYVDKKVYLILGGDDKGADLRPLFEFLKDKNIQIFAIGTNTKKLAELSSEYNLACHECHELKNAVESISRLHDTSSIAILSPAAASLDQFSGYKERGEKFKAYVRELT